ncbi:hypothetical protein ANO11243_039280 [Dothideomycetidae sp. 11243]|nr:hypothetical protein ANO11243_039280 [fungal sp. No.11243]
MYINPFNHIALASLDLRLVRHPETCKGISSVRAWVVGIAMLQRARSDASHRSRRQKSHTAVSTSFVHPEHARTAALAAYKRAYETTSPATGLANNRPKHYRKNPVKVSGGAHIGDVKRSNHAAHSTALQHALGLDPPRRNHDTVVDSDRAVRPVPTQISAIHQVGSSPSFKVIRKAKSAHEVILRKAHSYGLLASPHLSPITVKPSSAVPSLFKAAHELKQDLPSNKPGKVVVNRPPVSHSPKNAKQTITSTDNCRDNTSSRSTLKAHRSFTNPFKKRSNRHPPLAIGVAHYDTSLPPFNFAHEADVPVPLAARGITPSDSQSRSTHRKTSAFLKDRLKRVFSRGKTEDPELPVQHVTARNFHFNVNTPSDDCEDTVPGIFGRTSLGEDPRELSAMDHGSGIEMDGPRSRVTSWNSSMVAGTMSSVVSAQKLSSIRELPSQQIITGEQEHLTISTERPSLQIQRRRQTTSDKSKKLYDALCHQISSTKTIESGSGETDSLFAETPQPDKRQVQIPGNSKTRQGRLAQQSSKVTIRAVTPELTPSPRAAIPKAERGERARLELQPKHDGPMHSSAAAEAMQRANPFRLGSVPTSPFKPQLPAPKFKVFDHGDSGHADPLSGIVSSPSIYAATIEELSRPASPSLIGDTSVATVLPTEVKRYSLIPGVVHRTASGSRPSGEWRSWMSDQMSEIGLASERITLGLDLSLGNIQAESFDADRDSAVVESPSPNNLLGQARRARSGFGKSARNSSLHIGKVRLTTAARSDQNEGKEQSQNRVENQPPDGKALQSMVAKVNNKGLGALRQISSSTRLGSVNSMKDRKSSVISTGEVAAEAASDDVPWTGIAASSQHHSAYGSSNSQAPISLYTGSNTDTVPASSVQAPVARQASSSSRAQSPPVHPRAVPTSTASKARSSIDLRARVKTSKESLVGARDTSINIRRKKVSTSSATQFEDMTLQRITEGPYANSTTPSPGRQVRSPWVAAGSPRTPVTRKKISRERMAEVGVWNKENATPLRTPTSQPRMRGEGRTVRYVKSGTDVGQENMFGGAKGKSGSPGQRMAEEFLHRGSAPGLRQKSSRTGLLDGSSPMFL